MRILVTGGAGFIGSHYVRTMLSGGYPGFEDAAVTVLDNLTYAGNLANLAPVAGSPRLRFVQGDIADAALVGSLVPGHDAVVNFAAETHVDRSISGAAPFVATNVAGVQVLLQACLEAGTGPVVQVSTDEVYGSIGSGSWTEAAPLAPSSPYSAAKAGGDLMAGAYARTHGLDVRVTRCCNNYGWPLAARLVTKRSDLSDRRDPSPAVLRGEPGELVRRRRVRHAGERARGNQP